MLLLDPNNITIQAAAPDVNGDGTAGDDLNAAVSAPNIFSANYAGNNSVVTTGQVVTQLNTADVTLQATNDITVAAAIDASANTAGKTLTLQAGRDVIINAALTTSSVGGGSLILSAGNNVTATAALTAAGGSVTLSAGNNGTGPGLAGGTVTFGAVTAANLTIRFNPVSYTTTSGEIAAYAPKATLTGTFDARAWTFINNASASAQSKSYDGTTAATLNTPFTFRSGPDGVTAGQIVSLNAGSAVFNNAHVASATTVNFTGYALSGGGDSSNYALFAQPTSQSQTITAKTLTPTLTNNPVTKIYNGTTAAPVGFTPTFSFAGLVSGDTTALLANTGSVYDTKNVATATKVTVSGLSLTGITGSNSSAITDYVLDATTKDVAATISAAALTLSGTRVYNGTTFFAGTSLTATGVNGETFTVTGAGDTTNLATKNVQTNQALGSVTGLAVGTGNTGAALATNYTSLATAGSAVSVTAASLTASTSNVVKTYSGDTTALGTAVVTAGTLFGSDSLSGGTFAFTTKDVGIANKTVTVSGVSVNDGNAGNNYTLTQAANTTSTINPAALTLSGTRVYNGTTFFAGAGLTATGVNGETFTVTGAGDTTNLATKNVQTNQALASVTGLTVGTGNTGAALATNYTSLATAGSAVSVTAASLTASTSNVVKTYSGDTTALGTAVVTAGTLFGTDSVSGGTFAFTTKDVGLANKTVTVSGISVNDSNSGNNYTLTQAANTTSTINPATLTYTANTANRLVGGVDPAFSGTISGFVAGETQATATTGTRVFSTTAINTSPAGLYPINGSGLTANNGNYLFVQAAGNAIAYTIGSQAPLIITADNKTKTYGAVLPAFTATYAGFINGDTAASVTGLQYSTLATLGSNVGTFTITPFGATAHAYYIVGYVPGTLTINPAALTLSGTRVYNGTTFFAGTGLTATGVNGETFTVTGAGDTTNLATKNVQTNQALASVTGLTVGTGNTGAALATNYTSLATAGSAVSVTAASLTASTSNVVKTYSGDTTALGTAVVTAGTLFGTDSVSGGTFAFTTKDVGLANKTVTVSGISVNDGNSGNNYTLTQAANTTSTINPATLTYTANTANRLVGGVDPAFSGTISGFVGGETQAAATTGVPLFSTTAISSSPAGLYPINGSGLTANNGNYVFVQAASNAIAYTIGSQAPLIITADNKTKTYGAALPAFTATYAGFINGDTAASVTGLQYSTLATLGSNVGTYIITPFGATAPAYYVVGYVTGTLTINPATLTYTANLASRLVGGIDPVFSGTISGFVAGGTQPTATTGTPLFSTTAINTSPPGLYPINGSGLTANNGNYVFVQAPSNAIALTIGTQAPLIITADNKTKTYGAALPAFTATYGGFINGDTAASVTGLRYSTLATLGSNVGTFTITPFGATAPAYYLVGYVPGTLTINPAALTLTASNATRLYGAANPGFGASFAGLVNGDTSAVVTGLQLNTPATSASNVGNYAINPTGATAPNYAVTFVPGTLTIERASLTLTAADAARAFGAANPAFTGTFSGFVNGDTAAVVDGLVYRTPATPTSAAGDYTIEPFGATASNYTLAFVNGTLRIAAPSIPVGPTPLALTEFSQRIASALSDVKGWPVFQNNTAVSRGGAVGGASAAGEPNQGGFELVTSFPGRTWDVAALGTPRSTQLGDPDLFRESSVSMGGFNVVYRETIATANQQAEAHTALGSSYRDFSDAENPQVRLLRAKGRQMPASPTAQGGPQGAL